MENGRLVTPRPGSCCARCCFFQSFRSYAEKPGKKRRKEKEEDRKVAMITDPGRRQRQELKSGKCDPGRWMEVAVGQATVEYFPLSELQASAGRYVRICICICKILINQSIRHLLCEWRIWRWIGTIGAACTVSTSDRTCLEPKPTSNDGANCCRLN